MGLMQRWQATVKAAKIFLGSDGIVDKNGVQLLGGASQDNITAHSGGGQSSAVPLVYGWNRLATVAAGNDSVALPAAVPNAAVVVINDGADAAKVYGQNGGSDTIDGTAGATGVALTNAHRAIFYCLTAGAWQSLASTKSS